MLEPDIKLYEFLTHRFVKLCALGYLSLDLLKLTRLPYCLIGNPCYNLGKLLGRLRLVVNLFKRLLNKLCLTLDKLRNNLETLEQLILLSKMLVEVVIDALKLVDQLPKRAVEPVKAFLLSPANFNLAQFSQLRIFSAGKYVREKFNKSHFRKPHKNNIWHRNTVLLGNLKQIFFAFYNRIVEDIFLALRLIGQPVHKVDHHLLGYSTQGTCACITLESLLR